MRHAVTETESEGVITPLAVLVHELRQPLAAISCFAQANLRYSRKLMKSESGNTAMNASIAESTEKIIAAIEHAAAIVERHLERHLERQLAPTVARSPMACAPHSIVPAALGTGMRTARRAASTVRSRHAVPASCSTVVAETLATDIDQIVREAWNILEPMAVANHVRWLSSPLEKPNAKSEGSEPFRMTTLMSAVELRQVLLNIMRNGIEAATLAEGNRWIRVTTEQHATRICIQVTNSCASSNGAAPLATKKTTGLGIGLTVCRDLVDRHGGQLWFATPMPTQTTVCFTVPRMPTSDGDQEHGDCHRICCG